ncbi:alkene reductase [Psychromicrobium lacuslunae]|uniref:1,2-oxophytodienoate reductase n=1 Tax=Psychromicrobium lacuslunae TaxID=1618207 RepID=A0A0D4BYT6_9MICC|nr:alkene reductase [Psychromicrobium lacuslunae]AJT41271.1 1,2-oxophytodienoate reductase [Psychromicrobium lacuslunae]
MSNLWDPISLGNTVLKNRLAMAPMTRNRTTVEGVPTELTVEYYRQRSGLGLIITEGTQPSAEGQGYLLTPGIYNQAQIEGWAKVADAVHAEGSALFIQVMHAGRISHPDNTLGGTLPVAPSAVNPETHIYTLDGAKDIPTPRELATEEIAGVVEEFRTAARSAIAAGADGIEIHSANGYLLHQFLSPNTNLRADGYGGDIAARARIVLEVVRAAVEEIGADRVGIRLSPNNGAGGTVEGENYRETYQYLVQQLAPLGLAYLHLLHIGDEGLLGWIRENWPSRLILNRAGRPVSQIGADIQAGLADIESVGQPVLANPDLQERLQSSAALNEADASTFYGGGQQGYTDYPTLQEIS